MFSVQDDYPLNSEPDRQTDRIRMILSLVALTTLIFTIIFLTAIGILLFLFKPSQKTKSASPGPTVTVTKTVTVERTECRAEKIPLASEPEVSLVTAIQPSSLKGRIFYSLKEDLKQVPQGYLPPTWSGGEKLMIIEDAGRKYIGIFEPQSLQSATINHIPYPRNYTIKCSGFLEYYDVFEFRAGTAVMRVNNWSFSLNNTKAEMNSRIENKIFTLIFEKKGALISCSVDGNKPIIVRDPEFQSADVFSFSMGCSRREKSKLYDIEMTDLGE